MWLSICTRRETASLWKWVSDNEKFAPRIPFIHEQKGSVFGCLILTIVRKTTVSQPGVSAVFLSWAMKSIHGKALIASSFSFIQLTIVWVEKHARTFLTRSASLILRTSKIFQLSSSTIEEQMELLFPHSILGPPSRHHGIWLWPFQ